MITMLVPGFAPNGSPILAILSKKTFAIAHGEQAAIHEFQEPFLLKDEYWALETGIPGGVIKLETDVVAYKPMTDVIVLGNAKSPYGKAVKSLGVGLEIDNTPTFPEMDKPGSIRHSVKVYGNRRAYVGLSRILFSEPEPFTEMPMDLTRAYGGRDEKSTRGISYACPKNMHGKGFCVSNKAHVVQDLDIPNLEDPGFPLTPENMVLGKYEDWREGHDPVGMGYTGKGSFPRVTFSGLTPDQWAEAEVRRQISLQNSKTVGTQNSSHLAPIPPLLNLQFFNGAFPGLAVPYLRGNETLRLFHLDHDFPTFSFRLPGIKPVAWMDVGDGPFDMGMILHTLTIDMQKKQLTMLWRGYAFTKGLESLRNFKVLEYGIKED